MLTIGLSGDGMRGLWGLVELEGTTGWRMRWWDGWLWLRDVGWVREGLGADVQWGDTDWNGRFSNFNRDKADVIFGRDRRRG